MKTIDQIEITRSVAARRGNLPTRTVVESPVPASATNPAVLDNGSAVTREHPNAICPFRINAVPEAELSDLRKRINATRWPERETVADASQGVQLATTQALARYWATEYDWRKI